MRLLAVLAVLALALSGCLQANTVNPQSIPSSATSALAPVVHRAGALLPATAEQVLGAAPSAVEKLLGTRGGEPNIGVTSSGAMFVTSGDFVMKSTDLGTTWTPSYEFGGIHNEATPFTADPVRNSDPMLWVDADTDRIFAPFMFPVLVCSEGVWSDDDGATWFDRPVDCGLPGVDHQKLATGHYVEGSTLPKMGDYPNVVYYCYNNVRSTDGASNCAVSTDGGMTFPWDNTALDGAAGECGGINGHPHAAPDGKVYLASGDNCSDNWVARSDDNGQTWRALRLHVDGLGQAEADPEFTSTPDGTTYYMWRAAKDNRVYVVSTHDGFETVSRPHMVSPPDVTSTRFVAMSSGDDGKVAFAYLGTRDSAARAGEVNDASRWHLFLTWAMDAAADEPTFVTVQVTPAEDPVQIGYQWEGGGGDPARNLLDFIDMVTGPDGRVYVALTDGCTTDCANNATATKLQSRARDTAVAVQLAGPLLYSMPRLADPNAARDAATTLPQLPWRIG
jgi:BNR repeat protein